MLTTAQIVTLLLVALAMATRVAHALELPGKMRLPRDTYLAVQSIYYPGFLVGGGLGEFAGMLYGRATLLDSHRVDCVLAHACSVCPDVTDASHLLGLYATSEPVLAS